MKPLFICRWTNTFLSILASDALKITQKQYCYLDFCPSVQREQKKLAFYWKA